MTVEDAMAAHLRDIASLLAELQAQFRELARPGLPKGQYDALVDRVADIGDRLAAVCVALGELKPVQHVEDLPPVEFDN